MCMNINSSQQPLEKIFIKIRNRKINYGLVFTLLSKNRNLSGTYLFYRTRHHTHNIGGDNKEKTRY